MDFLGLDVGPGEVLLILIVLFIFVGPQRLPEVARGLGKAYRKLKEATRELTEEIEKMGDEVKDEFGDVRKGVSLAVKPKTAIVNEIKDILKDIDGLKKDIRSDAQSAVSGLSGRKDEAAAKPTGVAPKEAKEDEGALPTPDRGNAASV